MGHGQYESPDAATWFKSVHGVFVAALKMGRSGISRKDRGEAMNTPRHEKSLSTVGGSFGCFTDTEFETL